MRTKYLHTKKAKKARNEALNSVLADKDLMILGLGFLAGTQGYTPVTSIMKLSPGWKNETQNSPQNSRDRAMDTIMTTLSTGPGPISFWRILNYKAPSAPEEEKKTELTLEYLAATSACGAMGAIEAYAVTRPGFVTGMANALGQIIPG